MRARLDFMKKNNDLPQLEIRPVGLGDEERDEA